VSDFLGELGGFQSAIFFLGTMLTAIFARRVFYSSLIKKIYQIDQKDKKTPANTSNKQQAE
jgi:hypothetical protein